MCSVHPYIFFTFRFRGLCRALGGAGHDGAAEACHLRAQCGGVVDGQCDQYAPGSVQGCRGGRALCGLDELG